MAAPPVAAHEIGVVLVAPPTADGATRAPSLDGFRLAVDESPDVSHPPGADAGDHLGGIDVDLTVVRPREDREVAVQVGRAVTDGARVVVMFRRSSGVQGRRLTGEVIEQVRSSAPLIVVAGGRDAVPERPVLPVVLLRDRVRSRIDRDRLARFERRFARRHGRASGRAARVGYDAGRLVDRLLAQLGEGSFRQDAIVAAARAAGRSLVGATTQVVRAEAGTPDPAASRSEDDDEDGPRRFAAFLAAGGAAAVLAFWLARRRSRTARS